LQLPPPFCHLVFRQVYFDVIARSVNVIAVQFFNCSGSFDIDRLATDFAQNLV
jgi:hypothetical protein